jgi:hypothetical protein
MNQEYADLIERVRKIDSEAADYMEEEAPKLCDFNESNVLWDCFIWMHTPQGTDYWADISDKLGENE